MVTQLCSAEKQLSKLALIGLYFRFKKTGIKIDLKSDL